jgi:hypothetical protein
LPLFAPARVSISENANTFCRMIKARSREHHEAMRVALDKGWLTIAGSMLRMELDSMIRVIWLLRHPDTRKQTLASYVAGEGFNEGRKRISDSAMAEDAADVNDWVQAVYRFLPAYDASAGCAALTDCGNSMPCDPSLTDQGAAAALPYAALAGTAGSASSR